MIEREDSSSRSIVLRIEPLILELYFEMLCSSEEAHIEFLEEIDLTQEQPCCIGFNPDEDHPNGIESGHG